MSNFFRRTLAALRERQQVKERQDAQMLRMSVGALELMVELRAMADYDRALPSALADHMRKDLWNDATWVFAAIAMTDQAQKLRILGHRLRIGAGWDTNEATIDSTEAHSVRVVHAARGLWVAAEGLHTVDDQHWWGTLCAGRFLTDGTYGPTGADRGPSPIEVASLARSVPELLAKLSEKQPDLPAKPADPDM